MLSASASALCGATRTARPPSVTDVISCLGSILAELGNRETQPFSEELRKWRS